LPILRRPGPTEWFTGLDTAVTAETTRRFGELCEEGWTTLGAQDCLEGYATWLKAHLDDAVRLGIAIASALEDAE